LRIWAFGVDLYTFSSGSSPDSSPISEDQVQEFLTLRKIQGICDKWLYQTTDIISKYHIHTDNTIDERKMLEYIQNLKDNYYLDTYQKRTYAIRKFL